MSPKSLSTSGELTSAWTRSDAELLDHMLKIYPRTPPPLTIVDVTYGKGIMHRHGKPNERQVIGYDLDPERAKDGVASYDDLPLADATVDVLIFDPPHLVKSGTKGVIKNLYNEFATGTDPLTPFFLEAKRVLKPEGVIFTKTCNYVNSGRFHWQTYDLLTAVRACGLCPCDEIVKVRPASLRHPAWTCQLHARKRHSYWYVIRNSCKC